MIQFNLLPDVKLEYRRTTRTKRSVMMIAVLVSGVSLGLMVLLFLVVNGVQRTHLSNLNDDIASLSKELEDTPDLDKVLTVQNQLNRLTELHDKKPVASRLSNYLTQVTPVDVTIAELNIDFANSTMTVKGAAPSLKQINAFADTLKFTDYNSGEDSDQAKAFSNVVLKNFGRDAKGASYELELTFDPVIFSSAKDVKLSVPNTTTTRSVVEKPGPLFQPLSDPEEESEE